MNVILQRKTGYVKTRLLKLLSSAQGLVNDILIHTLIRMRSSTLNRSVLFTTLYVKRLSDLFAPRVSYVNEAIVVVVVVVLFSAPLLISRNFLMVRFIPSSLGKKTNQHI